MGGIPLISAYLILQVIAFADALLTCKKSGIKKVLVLCPVNTINNWKIEFFKWIPFAHDYRVSVTSTHLTSLLCV